jgi:hypothetical protein
VISSENIGRDVNNSRLNIWGGSNMTSGGRIILYGSDYTTASDKGRITLQAFDGSSNSLLYIYPNGTFTFNNNGTSKTVAFKEDVIPRSGGAVITNYFLGKTTSTSSFMIGGGTTNLDGASIEAFGSNSTSYFAGAITLTSVISGGKSASIFFEGATLFRPSTNGTIALGNGNYRWGQIYSSNSAISTSDSRLKNTITDIDDNLLDAWETIQPKQYKFNDATESKGEQARFRTGYLAQDIEKACTDNNIDATRYGLFCYDSWEEEPEITEDVEVENDGIKTTEKRIVQSKKEKGDIYALRYEEALVVECAYLRREINKLKEELNQLKAK